MADAFAYMAPGKVILFGEHFVVHGARAVMCAIDRRVVAESYGREGRHAVGQIRTGVGGPASGNAH